MKATMTSTNAVVSIDQEGKIKARVWEGVTEAGVPFTAYIALCQVHKGADNTQFERELSEHKPPERATQRAIDARFII